MNTNLLVIVTSAVAKLIQHVPADLMLRNKLVYFKRHSGRGWLAKMLIGLSLFMGFQSEAAINVRPFKQPIEYEYGAEAISSKLLNKESHSLMNDIDLSVFKNVYGEDGFRHELEKLAKRGVGHAAMHDILMKLGFNAYTTKNIVLEPKGGFTVDASQGCEKIRNEKLIGNLVFRFSCRFSHAMSVSVSYDGSGKFLKANAQFKVL